MLECDVTYSVDGGRKVTKTMNVREKIVAVLNAMKNSCPYYFWVISGLKLIE